MTVDINLLTRLNCPSARVDNRSLVEVDIPVFIELQLDLHRETAKIGHGPVCAISIVSKGTGYAPRYILDNIVNDLACYRR